MKTNYHTHCQRCRHAQGTEEDYVQAALAAGLDVLGFSDHIPFPGDALGYRMPYSELGEYLAAVDRLAAEHTDIVIKKGLEAEYFPNFRGYYEELLHTYQVDYLLLGEHFFLHPDGHVFNLIAGATGTDDYVDYAHAVEEAMRTGLFRVVVHPDIFAMSPFAWDKNCDAATDIILNGAAATGTILEFNANGLRRGIHTYPDGDRPMYPHRKFWERAAGSGIPVIVGSDCHDPSQVWDRCVEDSYRHLKELGITPIDTI